MKTFEVRFAESFKAKIVEAVSAEAASAIALKVQQDRGRTYMVESVKEIAIKGE
jgi:hypothetical protein